MAKDLPPKDAALWKQVARTVRPLGAPKPPEESKPPGVRVRVRAPEMPAVRGGGSPSEATLDGGWDRRLRKGRVEPQRTVDLHGLTQAEAHARLVAAVQDAFAAGLRTLLVITGKPRGPDEAPRGILSKMFPIWCEGAHLRPYIAAIRPAAQRHGGAGASFVVLRRRR